MLAWLLLPVALSDPPEDGPQGVQAPDEELEVVTVEAPRMPPGARMLGEAEIATTPVRDPVELVRALPGMHLSAHGGRGKAWQFLYRGFDAEHGSDIAVSLDGVPLNEPSNLHAHGYVDAAVLPNRLVRGVTLQPGSDTVAAGPFGVAATIDFDLGLERTGTVIHAVGGTDRSGQLTLAWRPDDGERGTFLLAEIDGGAGVTDSRDWRMARVAAGAEGTLGRTHIRSWLLAYTGGFDTPGALRDDDVEADRIGFYEGYPDAGDGLSRRVLGAVHLDWAGPRWTAGVLAWGGARELSLDQDFTGFLRDEARGDGTRQHHRAGQAGLRVQVSGTRRVAGHPWALRGGLEATEDALTQQEDRIDTEDVLWGRVRDGRLNQVGFSGWLEGEAGWNQRLRLVGGLRVHGWWQRISALDDPLADGSTRTLGVPAPRVRLEGRPHDRVTLFAGWGRGYRPPRADGGVFGARAHADTAQAGLTTSPFDAWSLTVTGFTNHLDDEQVFDHVSGRFLGQGASRRLGAELLTVVRPLPWLFVEGALTFTDGRFTATGEPVPFAPRWMGSLHLGAHAVPLPLGTLDAGLRAWVLGRRPLPSGFVSRVGVSGSALVRWDTGPFALALQIDNVFGNRWRDGEFVYASWWDTSRPRSQLPALHLTAGTPTAARLHLEVRL